MNIEELRKTWKQEESLAHIQGWDFSHIKGRYKEEHDLPWSYDGIVRSYLQADKLILDYDTGGGEYLLTLKHSIEFYDVGAFVWFARIIEWEFPGFSVDRCFDKLLEMHTIIENMGKIRGTTHRYLLVVKK